MIAKCVYLPEQLVHKMHDMKQEKGISHSSIIRLALDAYLKNKTTEEKNETTKMD